MKKKKIEVEEQTKTEEERYQEQLQKMEEEEKFSFWRMLKEAWSNKRYRAMIILVFWFIFLFVIAGGLRQAPKQTQLKEVEQEKKSSLEIYRDMDNYEFTTNLTFADITTNQLQTRELVGRRYNYQEEFEDKLNKTSYFIDNGIVYQRSEGRLETSQEEFIEMTLKPDMTYRMLEDATLEATTNYKDGSILKTYTINLKKFIAIYHNSHSNAKGKITITTKEKDNQITEATYDLLSFMNQQQVQYSAYGITITYKNIGKVDSIHLQ